MIKIEKIFSLSLLMFTVSLAQLNITMESSANYASNIFSNYLQQSDYINNITLKLSQNWIKETVGWRLSYRGEINQFSDSPDLSWQNHSVAANYYLNWNENLNSLNAAFSVSKRLHRDSYQWYEQWQVNGFFNTKWVLAPQLFGYTGVNIKWRRYPLLSPFSYHQETLYLRFSRFFDTGTTLIFESDLMGKDYIDNSTLSTVADLPQVVTQGDGTSVQIVGLMRVAQALSRNTGFNMELVLRHNLQTAVRYLGNDDGFYFSEEEVFDTIFGYHGEQLSSGLKQNLPWSVQMNLGGLYENKRYDNRLAATLDGTVFSDKRLRTDERWLVWLNIKKTFVVKSAWQPLAVDLTWSHLNNRSNDPYYQYNSSYWSLGLSLGF